MGNTQRNGSSSSPNSPTEKALYETRSHYKTEFGETDTINIGKGVREGCIVSPLLYNIYAE